MKKIPFKKTVKELFIDYLVILLYLAVLLVLNLIYIKFILGRMPEYTELQSRLIATFTSVIPVILIFSYLDSKGGSIGKRKARLELVFRGDKKKSSIIRNIIKFLPWQLGHLGVIHGVYHNFNTASLIIMNLGTVLGFILVVMRLFRKDGKHLGDLIGKTQVQNSLIK